MNEKNCFFLHMGKANCALDLGDGSERGEYVNQDYILNRLGRPHRAISLMFCYYPNDKSWPERASKVATDKDVTFQWDYEYDDYFPYTGGLKSEHNGAVFEYMKDIRRHGQDVLLTLTIDPKVSDEHLIAIAHDLRSFGRVMLRINHEATGDWFSFNKRCSYQEVADFFVHASRVIKREAPNIQTIICIGGIEEPNATEMAKEKEFAQTIPEADIWSIDKYMALHWGWPFDVAETGGKTHKRDGAKTTYLLTKRSFEHFTELNNGQSKPMVMSEFNADGDVTGPYDQCSMLKEFVEMLKQDTTIWLSGISMYQFRDRGRLGLEIEDPNNSEVGIEQPIIETYKEMLNDPYFMPKLTHGEEAKLPVTLRWGGSEDSDGIEFTLKFKANPHFCEAYFEDELLKANLMMELNGTWFYKAPGVKCIDFMSAFYKKPLEGAVRLTLKIFAPPASGENDPMQGKDWLVNYYTELKTLPRLRILYAPVK